MSVAFYGDYNLTETANIPFNTFSSDDPSASVTVTDLVAGDIYVHKDGVEGTPTGITVSLNVGTVNGNHLAILDLSDTNDAGFYAVGARYQVRMEGVTIDGATVNAWIGTFSIGCTLRPTTTGRTLDVNATGEAGLDLDNTSGTLDAAQLGADCITADKIADDAIAAEHLATGAIAADAVASTALNNVTAWTCNITGNLVGNVTGDVSGEVTLAAASQQDIAQGRSGRTVRYVDANAADDTGDGLSWDTADKTIGAAITAASAGDLILIGPGTYAEDVDATGKANLTIVGAGRLATIISSTNGTALDLASGSTVRHLKATSSGTTSIGIRVNGVTDIVAEDCIFEGATDAWTGNVTRATARRCYLTTGNDSLNLYNSADWLFEDCFIETDSTGSAASASHAVWILLAAGKSGILRGCTIRAIRSDVNAQDTIALAVEGSASGQVTLEDCVVIARQTSTGAADVVAIGDHAGAGTVGDVLVKGCEIFTSTGGAGTAYDLWQQTGDLAVDGNTHYDTAKTGGTITAKVDTINTNAARLTAARAQLITDWADGERLDLLLDAVATVAEVNAQVLDVLNVDTFAEPATVPAATASLVDKIGWLYALARNKITQTATTQTLRNDADDGNIATASVTDDGTTGTRGEFS